MVQARASALMVAALASASFGQATYLSQDRWISVTDCQGSPPKIIAAPDLGPFDEESFTSFTNSSAQQTSTLEPWLIKAKGKGYGYKKNGCCGAGASHFAATFEIDTPTAWALNGSLSVSTTGSASWKLTGPGVNILYEKKLPDIGFVALNESGVLDPGTYAITVQADAACYAWPGGSGIATYDFELAFGDACQADCDGSGSLDIDDFVCFQTLYALNEPWADCDGDGLRSIDDFICFQTLFAMGC